MNWVLSERLRRVRPVQPVYTRSADGFSLHRSGVMSLGGGNLKWTKSLEKRAKLASEVSSKYCTFIVNVVIISMQMPLVLLS